ncbi:uncharacterized protein LOC103518594 [Diaphorina citri]|uniref:Uncharacterized protein LOC103518594 n=1 Tax=Diaphorina citri TaxID=121845 RepID=A0A1S3DHQ2_DIACI|nr:uncharacterized protein LOC103518594 [Diaphorina citri]KAI5720473.1 hypothetical protein M8J77_007118 [Diaphorina citri]
MSFMGDQERNLKLIKEVQKHEELYNYTLPEYSRREVTDKAWQKVSARVNIPAHECKEKWRNLRTVFMRRLKPQPVGPRGKKKAYYLESAMQFILPFVRTSVPAKYVNIQHSVVEQETVEHANCDDKTAKYDHETIENAETSSEGFEDLYPMQVEASEVISPGPSLADGYFEAQREPPEAETSSHKIDRHEGLKMFLLSLLSELEELSHSQVKIFKRRVLSLIDEISTTDVP